MMEIARIRTAGGVLILPAGTAYDWQLLFEYVARLARRCGRVRLRARGTDCTVTFEGACDHRPCQACNGRVEGLAYRLSWRVLCGTCAWARLAQAPASAPPAAMAARAS